MLSVNVSFLTMNSTFFRWRFIKIHFSLFIYSFFFPLFFLFSYFIFIFIFSTLLEQFPGVVYSHFTGFVFERFIRNSVDKIWAQSALNDESRCQKNILFFVKFFFFFSWLHAEMPRKYSFFINLLNVRHQRVNRSSGCALTGKPDLNPWLLFLSILFSYNVWLISASIFSASILNASNQSRKRIVNCLSREKEKCILKRVSLINRYTAAILILKG